VAAMEAATAAARAARVLVRPVSSLAELTTLDRMLAGIWQDDASGPLLSTELLRALAKSGNYVAGAFDGGTLVGAAVAFFAAPGERELHSHIAGVSAAAAGRSVGFALKQHQRVWALQRGISTISWTFDPLVARNAYFNVVKLAARPIEYMPNFYGLMLDTLNGDGDSDRLLVRWSLRDPAVAEACGRSGEHRPDPVPVAGAVVAVGTAADGSPEPGRLDGATSVVAVPRDITALRASDPALAAHWRRAVRDAMTGLLAQGAAVVGFDRARGYVLRRNS